MNTHKLFNVFMIISMLVMALGTPLTASAEEPPPTKVGLITDANNHVSEMAWGWLAYQGLLKAQTDLGIVPSLYEPLTDADYDAAVQQCVDDGNSLCIGVGFLLAGPVENKANQYPDVKFAVLDYSFDSPSANLRGIRFDEKQSGYLAGALAGLMTTSEIIGAVGGMEIQPVVDFVEGYRNGAQCANPDVNVLIAYTGNFDNPADGTATAQAMISQNVDVVFAAAGSTGTGAIRYSSQHDVWSIGVDTDEYLSTFDNGAVDGSDKLLTSAMKNPDFAVYQTIEDYLSGAFSSGTVTYHLLDGGVGLAPYHKTDASVPQSTKEYVESVKAGILDENIDINATCRAEPPQYYPSFSARLTDNEVHGYGWLLGTSVMLTIDDLDNGIGTDYTDTQTVRVADWDPNQTFVQFRLWQKGFQLQPGQIVALADGMKIKTLEVANLTVTTVDVGADTVSGTADAGTQVDVGHIKCDQNGCFGFRRVYADENGRWIADFAHVGEDGDEQDIVDLVPGMGSEARQCDYDGECTTYGWRIPDPRLDVSYEHDWINISDFTPGGQVTYTIYDHQGGHALFGPVTGPVDSHGNGWISSNLFHTDLIPGNYIMAVNEATGEEVSVLIRNVNLDYISADDDRAFGTAEPNTTLQLNIGETHDAGFNLNVPVDEAGYWEVNLAAEGHPIDGYRYASANLYDAEGDAIIGQSPWIDAEISTDSFGTTNFSKNADVTFTLYDSLGGTILYGPVTYRTDGSGAAWVNLWDYGIDLVPGNYIVAHDHHLNFTKSLEVEPFDFQELNAADDSVSGTAAVGEWVDLHVESLFSNWGMDALTDASGRWFRDYGAENYDITEQMWANGWAVDDLGNRSHDHTTGLPGIEASTAEDWISGFNFSPDRQVRIRIYASEGASLLAAFGAPLADLLVTVQGNTQFYVDYWQHHVDLQPGMYILAEDLETGKSSETTLARLTFDGVDYDADTAWGTADSNALVVLRANHLFDNYEFTVDADGSGNWSADFASHGADITPEWDLRAVILDSELDATVANAPKPPVFTASLNGEWINGNNWTPSNTVQIQIYASEGALSIAGPFTWGTDNYGNFNADLRNEGVNLQPGNYITITDDFNGVIKALTLPNLTIDTLDPDLDVAGGLAPANTRLRLNFNNKQEGVEFDLFSDSDGTWQANFAAYDFDLQPGSNGSVRIFDEDGDAVQVDGRVLAPYVEASPYSNWIHARDWALGTSITLEIDDPSDGTGDVDYTATDTIHQAPWNPGDPNDILAEFEWPDQFEPGPGYIITASGGGTSKTLVVSVLNVTSYNINTDTISGIAMPGAQVEVCVNFPDHCASRYVTADATTGEWTADYAHRGTQSNEQEIVDLQADSNGWAAEYEADSDRTWYDWQVIWPPTCLEGDSVSGHVYGPDGTTPIEGARVVIEDAATNDELYGAQTDASGYYACGLPDGQYHVKASSIEYSVVFYEQTYPETAAEVVVPDDAPLTADFRLDNPIFTFDNLIFNMDDPLVGNLAIRQAIAHGTNREEMIALTYPGAPLLNTFEPERYWAYAANGLPTYDYDPAQARQILTDAGWVDTDGDGIREDSDGDPLSIILLTSYLYNLDHPRSRQIPIFVQNMADIGIQIVVDNSGYGDLNVPYGIILVGWGGIDLNIDAGRPGSFAASYRTGDLYHQEANWGHYSNADVDNWIDLAEAATTRSDKIAYLQNIQVQVMNDLAILPISERIGDLASMPHIQVRANTDQVEALAWAMGDTLTLVINNPETGAHYTTTGTVSGTAPWDSSQTYIMFDLSGVYDIQPGDEISASNGAITKTTVVSSLAITDIQLEADTVYGASESNQMLSVWTCWQDNPCINRDTTADQNGNWSENFGVPGDQDWETQTSDLKPGIWVDSAIWDEDGDGTMFGENVPNPYIGVRANDDQVEAWGWNEGETVTLEIEHPGSTDDPYSTTGVMGLDPGDPNQTYLSFNLRNVYDIQPGDTVRVGNDRIMKTTIVTDILITGFDVDLDTVSGTVATPGKSVEAYACDKSKCITRRVDADASGYWIADFANPGTEGDEQELFDIVPGTWLDSHESDEDGDWTFYGINVPNAYVEVYPVDDEVVGANWPAESTVTLTIDDPDTSQAVDYTFARTVHPLSYGGDKDTVVAFRLTGLFDIQPGYIVTLSDGTTSKTLVVSEISVSVVDPDSEIVSGMAAAGTDVYLDLSGPQGIAEGISRHEVADGSDQWSADVSEQGYDLQPGVSGTAAQPDEDGDKTIIRVAVVTPLPPDVVLTDTVVVPLGSSIQLATAVALSGDPAWIGLDAFNAVQLAIEDFGPIQGFDVTQTPFDSGCTEFLIAQAAALDVIANPDYVGVIGHACSGSYEAGLPLYEAAGLVTISGSSTRFDIPYFGQSVSNRIILNDYYYDSTLWTPIVQAMPEVQDWNARYQTRFNDEPGEFAALYYDATILLLKRIAETSQRQPDGTLLIDRAELASAVRTTQNYEGVTGCLSLDGRGDRLPEEASCNQPPHADAGPDQTVAYGQILTLDASASSDPEAGPLTFEWDLDHDGEYDDASGVTTSISFTQIGSHTIGLRVTDSGGLSDTDEVIVTVEGWKVMGFYQPVDMNGVYNLVKGGSTVPLRFEIFAGATELTDIADVRSFTYAETTCSTNAITDQIELTVIGGTSLHYDAETGQFIYNWKTPRTSGKCYRVTLITLDGTSLLAYFKLK